MHTIHFFTNLVIILVSAKIMAELFTYIKLPSTLGEVVAGLILGPSLFGIVQVEPILYILAEIGVMLLLFEVGLETDVSQLVKVGRQSLLVAITGIVAPALLVWWVAHSLLQIEPKAAIFIAGALVATSIGISLRVLMELGMRDAPVSRVVLGAAVMDDIGGVLILTVLVDMVTRETVDPWSLVKVFGFILTFMALAPVAAKAFSPVISFAMRRGKTQGIIPTLTVAVILSLAVLSEHIGAPAILGAFAAGIALSRNFHLPAAIFQKNDHLAHEIEKLLKPIIDLFVPVFFFVVGASINLRVIDFTSKTFWVMSLSLLVVATLGKMLSGIWAGGSWREKLFCGMAMVPRGEVGLIFAEVGKKTQVLDETMYALLVFIVAATTLLGPVSLRLMAGGGQTPTPAEEKVT